MSKASMDNQRVRKQIADALFVLLRQKPFSEITVTDIVRKANVARASYYRNYENKEAIIEDAMDNIRNELMKDIDYYDDKRIFDKSNVLSGFTKALTACMVKKADLLALYNNGFGSLLQEIFNKYIMEFAGNMPASSIERYKLYFISGAVMNVLIAWLNEGAIEPPEEIAGICVKYMEGGMIHGS